MAIQGNTDAIGQNRKSIDENSEGVAMAFAMAGAVPALHTGEQFAVAGSWGAFEGENGLAFGARMRVYEGFSVAGGVGAGLDNSSVGGTISGRYGW